MAKRICRTADRFDPTGARCCVRRATPPSCTAVVHEISQRDKDAFIFGEGCAGRFNRSESFVHTQSSAGFTIITSGFEFSVRTRAQGSATAPEPGNLPCPYDA